MRVAEQVGDITAPALAAFYGRYPMAREAFEALGCGRPEQLEAQMIENSLYCLMRWLESPGEIEIMLLESVPHHNDTLHLPVDWYGGMIEATAEIVASTIPANNIEERSVWNALRCDLSAIVDKCRKLVRKQITP